MNSTRLFFYGFLFLTVSLLGACSSTPKKPQGFTTQYPGISYETLWSAAQEATSKYFRITKADKNKGLIISDVRIDKDAKGSESKKAYIRLEPLPDGYELKVEVPYLNYQRFENIYRDELREGKRFLIVEKKKLDPPAPTDIYLEALLQSEIQQQLHKLSAISSQLSAS